MYGVKRNQLAILSRYMYMYICIGTTLCHFCVMSNYYNNCFFHKFTPSYVIALLGSLTPLLGGTSVGK